MNWKAKKTIYKVNTSDYDEKPKPGPNGLLMYIMLM